MKKRRLKHFVLPTLYLLIIVASFFTITSLKDFLNSPDVDYTYAKSLLKETTQDVLNEIKDENIVIVKPYKSDKVKIKTSYYNKEDDSTKQENSLIFYKDTYMPATGTLYESEEDFEVYASLPGEVKNVKQDNILGTVVEVSHNPNLTTFYYSLKNVNLHAGDTINAGELIGNSAPNEISDKPNFLFEVYYQGKSIDPEKFYEKNYQELQ